MGTKGKPSNISQKEVSFESKRRKNILLNIIIFAVLKILILFLTQCESKEVELTNEWYLLKENETVPHGVHVKMDMTTGEKWVKLADQSQQNSNDNKGGMILAKKEENVNDKIVKSVLEADGSLSI